VAFHPWYDVGVLQPVISELNHAAWICAPPVVLALTTLIAVRPAPARVE